MAFHVRLTPTVDAFIGRLNPSERVDFADCLAEIEQDPHADGRTKFLLPRPPIFQMLYYDRGFSIVYYIPAPDEVVVTAATRGPYMPPVTYFRRPTANGGVH